RIAGKRIMDSMFKTVSAGNNGHPSEDELLLYVDGELEAKATNHVRNHLEASWSCRVRTENIEETISSFIDYRNQVLKPLVEQPPHGWRGFDGRLNRLANEVGRPSLLANLRGTLGRIFSAWTLERRRWERGRAGSPAWQPRWGARLVRLVSFDSTVLLRAATTIVVIAVLVTGLIYFNRTPVVSASELLQRATDAQQRAITATNQAVIYQKLQVKRKTLASSTPETVTWEVWNDVVNSRIHEVVSDDTETRRHGDTANAARSPSPRVAASPRPQSSSLSLLNTILRANHMNP